MASLTTFIKTDPKFYSFFKKISRIISKNAKKKGLLFLGINFKNGNIVLYKGLLLNDLSYLGTVNSDYHAEDLQIFLQTIGVNPAEETMLPESFVNSPFIFYILNEEKQEKLVF